MRSEHFIVRTICWAVLSIVVVLACFLTVGSDADATGSLGKLNLVPLPEGYVPNARTAVAIAEAVWLPIFGMDIYDDWPFVAELVDDSIWVVKTTSKNPPPGMVQVGGGFVLMLSKRDGRVLFVEGGE